MKNKILSHFDVIKSYVEDNLIEACCVFAIVVVLIGVLFGSLSLSVHAAVNDRLDYPTSTSLRSGYVSLPISTTPNVVYDSAFVDEVAQALSIINDSPFRFRFENDGQVYLNNFAVVQDSTTSWRIVADNGFVSSQTVFRITASTNSTTIVSEDLEFVCTADVLLSYPDNLIYMTLLEALSQHGFCPSPFYFVVSGGGGTTPTCPTLPEMLADYTGSFESIVDMLNTKNYDEYDAWVNEVAQDARDAGKQEGLQEGFNIGKDAGYLEGEVDGFQDGYNKGTSDNLVSGFFANLFGGIIEAFDTVVIYDDGTLRISYWSIFCSIALLSLIIIIIKVWRGH